ncbi:hypothetical protein MSAN_01041000 [Mycena sanguinolenta]|uniref:Uncharacterized protein n=1 Tax=Mycena sanguinolenta TaxID=230812 RepID=A0A8H6YTY3_9AGAR|nr:hypothetical protein MSAN_01041000 [Mycena sanguinolenta]
MSTSSTSKHPALGIEKVLPEAPEHLAPLRKHQSSPFFNRTQSSPFLNRSASPFFDRPSDGRLRWIFPLPALVIALLTFVLATVFLLYLSVIRRVPDPGGSDISAIFVSELAADTLIGLVISTIATHTVSISVPFLIYVAAYCVAGKWLGEQEFPRQTRTALPTPLQYAFMVKMLTTTNIASVFQAGRYVREWRRSIQFPRAFHLALALTTLILGLSYSLILADIWLHGASSIVQGTGTVLAESILPVGLTFNQSVCTTSNACLNDTAGWASKAPWVTQTGLRIAANNSAAFSVVTINNASDLAVVVPTLSDPSLMLETPSFGVRAQCTSLTPNCTAASQNQCPGYPQGNLQLALGGNTTSSTNTTSSHSSTPTSSNTLPVSTQPVTNLAAAAQAGNPQAVRLQLQWSPNGIIRPANPTAIETSNGNILSWALCNMTFYNVTLWHQDGNYSVMGDPVLADSNFAAIMQGGLFSQAGNLQLVSNLQATMLAQPNVSGAVAALNQELGRLTLALFAGTLQPTTAATQHISQDSMLLGRYPFPPVIVYLVLLYAYTFTAAGIYVWAARLRSTLFRAPGYKTTSAVQLAQLRLTDPLALVAALYPSYPRRVRAGQRPGLVPRRRHHAAACDG